MNTPKTINAIIPSGTIAFFIFSPHFILYECYFNFFNFSIFLFSRDGSPSTVKVSYAILIEYLANNSFYEYQISQSIYESSKKEEHYPLHYDPILQFHDIIYRSFEEAYDNSDYNDNILSRIFWKYCGFYLED